jgi:chromosome partitioning protein
MGSQTIALLNMKGGVGKTTLAVNLAWYMYRHRQKRVLLIDLDPQFNASQYVMNYKVYAKHVKEKGTIADLLIESPKLRLKPVTTVKAIKGALTTLEQRGGARFDFLPAELALAHVVKNPAQMEYKLEMLLRGTRDEYDFIFLDCAPTDSVLTTMALNASNFILTPMRPDRFSILGFANLVETIQLFRSSSPDHNGVRELGLVFTQVRGDSGVESGCMRDIRAQAKDIGSYVFKSSLNWSNTFIRAVEDQTPAFDTRYARDELKGNIESIVSEMEGQILKLTKDDEDE